MAENEKLSDRCFNHHRRPLYWSISQWLQTNIAEQKKSTQATARHIISRQLDVRSSTLNLENDHERQIRRNSSRWGMESKSITPSRYIRVHAPFVYPLVVLWMQFRRTSFILHRLPFAPSPTRFLSSSPYLIARNRHLKKIKRDQGWRCDRLFTVHPAQLLVDVPSEFGALLKMKKLRRLVFSILFSQRKEEKSHRSG